MREVNALRADLPAELTRLSVEKFSSDNVNIAQVAIVSERAPWFELQDLAERLEDRLEAVPGVRGAETWGFPSREVQVQLDLGRLSELRIPASQVLGAIGSEAANVPAGSVDVGRRRFNVKTDGTYADIEEVRNTVVGGTPSALVRLRDVATVTWGYADPTHLARWNGRRAVWVTATQQEGQNIQRVRDGMWAAMDVFEKTLPAGVTLRAVIRSGRRTSRARLTRLGEDFAIALALVLVTLLPLGGRASLVVMVSIPLSLAIGVALLYATGYSVNQLSIVGAVIALGLLVDDSIVVIENIARSHARRHVAARGGDRGNAPDRRRGAWQHGDAGIRVRATAVSSWAARPVHPLAADHGDLHDPRVAVRVAHDHPVAREPRAIRRARARREHLPAVVRARHSRDVRAGARSRARPPAGDACGGGGARRRERRARSSGWVLAVPQGGDAAVPRAHRDAGRREPG